jgi:hypothetical protein
VLIKTAMKISDIEAGYIKVNGDIDFLVGSTHKWLDGKSKSIYSNKDLLTFAIQLSLSQAI